MKRFILIWGLVILANNTFAQDSTNQWNFGINVAAGGCFGITNSDDDVKPKFVLGGQFLFEYQRKWFNVGSGLSYSEQALRQVLDYGSGNPSGYADTRLLQLGIPINFKFYALQKEKLNLFIGLNASADFTFYYRWKAELLDTSGDLVPFSESDFNDGVYQKFFPSAGISLGIETKFKKNKLLRIEPFVSFLPMVFETGSFKEIYPLTAGVRLGFFLSKPKK